MQKPWLKFYEPHVPEHIDYPNTTVPDALRTTARKYPDHTALIFKDAKLSFPEYDRSVDRFAAALQGLGVKKGDRVPLGGIGKMYYRVRPARKARKGRNPRTGEEMPVPAKI